VWWWPPPSAPRGAARGEEIIGTLHLRAVDFSRNDQVANLLRAFGFEPLAQPDHRAQHVPVGAGVGVEADRHRAATEDDVFPVAEGAELGARARPPEAGSGGWNPALGADPTSAEQRRRPPGGCINARHLGWRRSVERRFCHSGSTRWTRSLRLMWSREALRSSFGVPLREARLSTRGSGRFRGGWGSGSRRRNRCCR